MALLSVIPGNIGERIRYRTKEQFLSRILARILYLRPVLHIQKFPPGLRMPCESLHEAGITVFAAIRTAHIWVYGIVAHGKIALREHTVYFDFSDYNI